MVKTKIGHYSEDSPYKAAMIFQIIERNNLQYEIKSVADIGCGAGLILEELSKKAEFQRGVFCGYDISPKAIELAQRVCKNKEIAFYAEDLLSEANQQYFDLLLVIDVIEHVPDYLGFAEKCGDKAKYNIYHIPLEISVLSVLRNVHLTGRRPGGHLHYFTGDAALATLKDAGHEIIDYFYTDPAISLFRQHPSLKRAIANLVRWPLSRFNLPFTARLLGGYSLLVLTQKRKK